jgi:hypothetical protein
MPCGVWVVICHAIQSPLDSDSHIPPSQDGALSSAGCLHGLPSTEAATSPDQALGTNIHTFINCVISSSWPDKWVNNIRQDIVRGEAFILTGSVWSHAHTPRSWSHICNSWPFVTWFIDMYLYWLVRNLVCYVSGWNAHNIMTACVLSSWHL